MVILYGQINIYFLTIVHLFHSRQIIQENSVWSALNFFYVAVMFHIYKIWKSDYKTIKDSGYVLKGLLLRTIFYIPIHYLYFYPNFYAPFLQILKNIVEKM